MKSEERDEFHEAYRTGMLYAMGTLPMSQVTLEIRETRGFNEGYVAGQRENDAMSDPYTGTKQSESLPRRTTEMFVLLESMPSITDSKHMCPKCLFGRNPGEFILTAHIFRYFVEGEWTRERCGHSMLGHDLMKRSCPNCHHTWFERPADYNGIPPVPEEQQ